MSNNSFHFQELRGAEATEWLPRLGALRTTVFHEFPYLYEGDEEAEREYTQVYAASERSLVVLLWNGEDLVGATTCLPLADQAAEFQAPFAQHPDFDVSEVFYFGESVVLAPFRGMGAGAEFFRMREEHARSFGQYRYTAFCAVDREDDHPMRPAGYRPLDSFWGRLWYVRREDLSCTYSWKEPGEEVESPKPLTFWIRDWAQTQ